MRKIRKWLPVLAAALVGTIALSAPAQAAPAATALRASVKAAAPAAAPFAVITKPGHYGHNCEKLGDDQGKPKALPTKAVICSNLFVEDLGGGNYLVQGENQGICITVKTLIYQQCANINMWTGTSRELRDGSNLQRGFSLSSCGHGTNPKCSETVTTLWAPGFVIKNGECWWVWGSISYNEANDTPRTSIELPSSALTVYMQPIPLYWETSAAYEIGNGC
jgi:hypothetical protein